MAGRPAFRRGAEIARRTSARSSDLSTMHIYKLSVQLKRNRNETETKLKTGSPLSRQKKIPNFSPRLFQTKLQAIGRTGAHLLIRIRREHHVRKINYSTNKVQVSYMMI